MDKIKLATLDNRELTFVGRDFREMLKGVKAIPGAKFVGSLKEYGETHVYNEWRVPYFYRDIESCYGPFAALRDISVMFTETQKPTISQELLDNLLDSPRNAWGMALCEAYRAGRAGETEPDYQQIAVAATTPGQYGHGATDTLVWEMRSSYQEGQRIAKEVEQLV